MELNTILQADARSGLKTLADKSIQCTVTSPPYWGLRKYGTNPLTWPAVQYSILGFPVSIPEMKCELGHEPEPKAFIGHLILIFREVYRVTRDDGTLWLNMGDSYAAGPKSRTSEQAARKSKLGGGKASQIACKDQFTKIVDGLKAKDLVGIPWMLAYALRDDGWYLRMDNIWNKPNPMPESVTDRPTKAHEYIFLLSKSEKYYYDAEAIRTPAKESSIERLSQNIQDQTGSTRVPGKTNGTMKAVMKKLPSGQANLREKRDKQRGHSRRHAGFNDRWDQMTKEEQMSMGANKKSVWTVVTQPFSEAHFATFPQELIVDCIKAGSKHDDIILDPFMGAGTTALVARKLLRNYIGTELNQEYIDIANKRLAKELGMFL